MFVYEELQNYEARYCICKNGQSGTRWSKDSRDKMFRNSFPSFPAFTLRWGSRIFSSKRCRRDVEDQGLDKPAGHCKSPNQKSGTTPDQSGRRCLAKCLSQGCSHFQISAHEVHLERKLNYVHMQPAVLRTPTCLCHKCAFVNYSLISMGPCRGKCCAVC